MAMQVGLMMRDWKRGKFDIPVPSPSDVSDTEAHSYHSDQWRFLCLRAVGITTCPDVSGISGNAHGTARKLRTGDDCAHSQG